MGYYINPRTTSKESWLTENAIALPVPPSQHMSGPLITVCLVDNGMFTAAGIAYSDAEMREFQLPDGRPKEWFAVHKDHLLLLGDPSITTLVGELWPEAK